MLQLSPNLKLIRLLSGKTQTEFGEMFDATKAMVISYEKGKANPDDLFLSRVSKYAGLSVADLKNKALTEDDIKIKEVEKVENQSYLEQRRGSKLSKIKPLQAVPQQGVPIYDVPIDASFLERVNDSKYFEPMYFINIPKLRNCNFGAIVSGSSMYPIMKSGSIAMCRLVEDLNYFDPGEMYLLATTNGFETVKYVQQGDEPNELLLIPHNEKIKPTTIKKDMVIRMCIVEAWLNFR
jgi:transcriptional regulator with XRE-family HTH domain